MDTELVIRAQGGDQEAFADLVYAIADRFLAVSHRILSDISLAEDATQQALLSIWQDLPQLRDPARFEAWSYRLLVRACYAEGRKSRRRVGNVRLLSVDEPMLVDGTGAVVDRDELARFSASSDRRTSRARRGCHEQPSSKRVGVRIRASSALFGADLGGASQQSGRPSTPPAQWIRSGQLAGGSGTSYREGDGPPSTASSGCSCTVARTSSNHALSY
jgi:DNA-directed RNA polymerase specialized sigma24 family protein